MKFFYFAFFFMVQLTPTESFATSPSTAERLELLIQQAQEAYFSEQSSEHTKKLFEAAAGLRYSDDWSPAQIKILHFSLLRLAQLSTNEAEKDLWLNESLKFAPELGVDPELFPPPLIARYEILKNVTAAPAMVAPQEIASEALALKPATAFWKNKNFWLLTGLLVSGYVIYEHENSRRKETAPPSTAYGL